MGAPPLSPSGASLATISTAPAPVRKAETKARANPPTIATAQPSDDRRTIHPPTKGVKKRRRKCPLPMLKDHSWEGKADGAWESWHAPNKARNRDERVYLGRVGKRLLAKWLALPKVERPATVKAWVDARRTEKGIG